MHDFDLVVVGCGGGPSENDLSSYFVKTSATRWNEGFLALEAGSGLGALQTLLAKCPDTFNTTPSLSPTAVNGIMSREPKIDPTTEETPSQKSERIYSCIRSFIVTHAHLDHISGLVLGAGSLTGPTRYIVALESTIKDLENVFNGRVWPRLVARQGELAPEFFYRYKPVNPKQDYCPIAPNLSARVMPVSHGLCTQSRDGSYESSAWFIRNDQTRREFLFFGDVEPDSVSINPRTRLVWQVAAPKIRDGTLKTIFLECSYRASRGVHELYGHLSPPYVIEELRSLATSIVLAGKRPRSKSARSSLLATLLGTRPSIPTVSPQELKGVLSGVTLVIIHCKTSTEALPDNKAINDVILDEVQALAKVEELGIHIVAARQGMKLEL